MSPPSRTKPRKLATAAPAGFTLTAGWAAALLGLLTLLFFHQVALEGQTFVSPDSTAPVGFVRMGEKSLYQDRVYPLWNPFVFLGMPSFGSGAYNPLIYPPDWPLALIARVIPLPEMTWMLLYYFLGAFFFYLLAREHGARPEGSFLGAVAFLFAPNLVAVGSHGHGSQLVGSAYVPLLLWLAARWMRRGNLQDLGWLALAGGFQMLRGHAQIAFYSWFAVGLYVLVATLLPARAADPPSSPATRLVRAASVLGAMAIAFGLAGFYNLPLRDYARHSIRGGGPDGGVGMEYATAWSLGPWELPSIVVPGWTGFGGGTYWGGMPFTDYPNAYMGMVTVALALPALLAWTPARVWAVILAGFSLLIAFGRYAPIYGFLYDHVPLFNKFRVPVMIVVLFQVAVALGLAWGWSAVLDGDPPSKTRPGKVSKLALAIGGALLLALLAGLVGQEALRGSYEGLVRGRQPQMPPEAVAAAFRGFVGDLARVSLIGLAAMGLGLLALRRKLSPLLASLGVLVLLVIELWPVSGSVMAPVIGPRVPNPLEQGRDDVVEFLEKAGPPGSFRVLPITEGEFRNNRLAGFAIANIGGYHAAKPRRYQDLVDSRAIDNPYWMRLLNVRYILSPEPLPNAGLVPVYQGSAQVYEFAGALPRATMVGTYGVAAQDTAIVDSISAGTRDPASFTWLERDPRLSLGPTAGATATITKYGLNEVTVETSSPGPALLRLADLWYPDWTATVDGRPAEILRADYALRAVPVPGGSHRVEFRYRSAAIRNGLTLSLVSLLAALALLAAGFFGRRRSRAPAVEATA
jgi:hypothetical protein